MKVTRFIQMYGLIELPKEVRSSFCLGYDPYYYGENALGQAADTARDVLKKLGMFFYRDSENGLGLVLEPLAGPGEKRELFSNFEKVISFKTPLECFFYTAKVEYPGIRPIVHELPTNIIAAKSYNAIKEKWGDTKQWLNWAMPVKLDRVTSGIVRLVSTLPGEGEYNDKAIQVKVI